MAEVINMAKAKNTPKKNGFSTQKLFKFVRIGALVAPVVIIATTPGLSIAQKIERGLTQYTGYHFGTKEWKWENMIPGWAPFVGASLATVGIPKIISFIRRL